MRTLGRALAGVGLLIFTLALPLAAQQPEKLLPPPDRTPALVLAQTGPHAPVTALAFTPDGNTLYVGGFDKQVRRYTRGKGKFEPAGAFRVPIGSGNAGVVNAIAVSPDGRWVAVAGRAPIRGEKWVGGDDGIDNDYRRIPGVLRRDAGVIYLFDPAKPDGGKVIRGLESEVRALAFANPSAGAPALVAAGIEWNDKGDFLGTVRVFNAETGNQLAERRDLPATVVPPGLAAWPTGPEKKGLRVLVGWQAEKNREPGKLLVWDIPGPGAKEPWLLDAAFNSPLAVRVGKDGPTEVITAGSLIAKFHKIDTNGGGLLVRAPELGEPKPVMLTAARQEPVLPIGVAALEVKGTGRATAVLSEVYRQEGPRVTLEGYELRLLTPTGERKVSLAGVADYPRPLLTASPEGRFVAVAGFTDNRVEVYDAANLATGNPTVEKLSGGEKGFGKVAFLAGEKLWLGSATDMPANGGVVLDFDRNVRAAVPNGGKNAIDAPKGAPAPRLLKPDATVNVWRVVATIGGGETTIKLPEGETATAAAILPAKPIWDAELGAVVAIAHIHERSQRAQVTLYDSAGKALINCGGPTLPVRSLAFSGTRALLAAAGDDGIVAVWSMKNVTRRPAVIEGVFVIERDGSVVVTTVSADSPAAGKLRPNDVIESVADAKGVQIPVKEPIDFLNRVRALKPGDNAQIKVKNKAPVAVVVGTATAFRRPLFTLWVNPRTNNGQHDWVGWTTSGPYDASGEAGEAHIGWLTTTGDPARPVEFAGANQYRKLFYKRDILRLLLEKADYSAAIAALPRPRDPRLEATLPRDIQMLDGLPLVRTKLEALPIILSDPDDVLDPDRNELLWQITGPGGASAWKSEAFSAGRLSLDLSQHDWKRGTHRIHIKLMKSGAAPADASLVTEIAVSVVLLPPPPRQVAVKIDGKDATDGAETTTQKDEVEVTATVDAQDNPDGATVSVSWPGTDKDAPRKPDGTFGPVKVKLAEKDINSILVRATNRGDGIKASLESKAVEVRVRKLPPEIVPPPAVKLLVLTPADFRTATDKPYVLSTQKVTITATVQDKNPITAFEWKLGDRDWEKGEFEPGRFTQTRDLDVPADKPLIVQVRAKTEKGGIATDTVTVVYDPLPEVSVAVPPTVVKAPSLKLSGGLKVTGKRNFKVRAIVTSSRTGRTREFDMTPNAARDHWDGEVSLFPGGNQLGYVTLYDDERKELRRAALTEVQYVRPPIVGGGSPIDVGTGTTGDMTIGVFAPTDAPPTELWVNGARVNFRADPKPFAMHGTKLWLVQAKGVSVNPGADRLKPITVAVRNSEGESSPVAVEVRGREEDKFPPPTIQLAHSGSAIIAERPLPPVSDPKFTFELKVFSERKLTAIEVWHSQGADAGQELVGGIKVEDAIEVPGGFELTARPALRLRPGPTNFVRIVASNGQRVSVEFNVSYTPPAVRVVIDAIKEPNGARVAVLPGTENLGVDGPVIDVEGRVLWDFDDHPVATDRNLSVVFVANGVTHLPVLIPLTRDLKDGKPANVRKFVGRVYLNSFDPNPKAPGVTRIRADLRSGARTVSIPQAGPVQTTLTVTSQNPFRRQRLHVLMLGVEIPDTRRRELVQKIVKAVGGSIPKDNPNFSEGRFERPGFEFAYMYTPRLGYTKAGDLNALLNAVREDIEERTKRKDQEWVNDVVVLYYQGEDWVDEKTGRWLLHSATTLSGAAGNKPENFAIRLDTVPQIPGMPVAVINVASLAKPQGDLALDLPFLRYAWPDPGAIPDLLPLLTSAVQRERTVEQMRNNVATELDGLPKKPTRSANLPTEVLSRVIGLGQKP